MYKFRQRPYAYKYLRVMFFFQEAGFNSDIQLIHY